MDANANWLNWWTNPVKLASAAAAAFWLSLPAVYTILVGLAIADIISGVLVAINTQTLSSKISWAGLTKKAMMFLIVLVASLVERYPEFAALGLPPLGQLVAGFYAGHEALSIIENAAAVGLPVPKFLLDALAKINGKE